MGFYVDIFSFVICVGGLSVGIKVAGFFMEALLPLILRPLPILISSVDLWVHSPCDPSSSLGGRSVA